MNELNHTNGKGDKERSPGWRDNYPNIAGFGTVTGFTRVNAGRVRKSYGNPASPHSAFVETTIGCACPICESRHTSSLPAVPPLADSATSGGN